MSRADYRELAAIFTGGVCGALARVGVSELFPYRDGRWPWAIFVVNVSGAFVLGYCVTRLQDRLPASTYRRPFIGTGVCGAFTTFSTMQLELLDMIRDHRFALAVGYAAASIVCGYLAIYISTAGVRRVRVIA